MFSFRRVYILVMMFATAVLITATASAQSVEQEPPEPLGEGALIQDAEEYALAMGVDIEEAVRRLQLQDIVGDLDIELTTKESDTFAGLWIDHTEDFHIIVQFTTNRSKEALTQYISNTPLANMVEVRTVSVSLAELIAIQTETLNKVSNLDVPVESGVNVFANRVELYVIDKGQLDNFLQETNIQLHDNVEIIIVDELSTLEADIYGGLALNTCTSGFGVKNGSGTKGITTAGHCSNSKSYNGVNLPFQSGTWWGSYDVQWHTTPGFTVRNLIYDGTYNRYIYSTKHRNNQALNTFVCKYGKATGKTCGFIIDKNYTSSNTPSSSATWIRVHRDGVNLSSGGDSGGPWFVGNTAYGTQSGGIGNDAFYMAINYIDILGLTVLTN